MSKANDLPHPEALQNNASASRAFCADGMLNTPPNSPPYHQVSHQVCPAGRDTVRLSESGKHDHARNQDQVQDEGLLRALLEFVGSVFLRGGITPSAHNGSIRAVEYEGEDPLVKRYRGLLPPKPEKGRLEEAILWCSAPQDRLVGFTH